MKKIASAIAVLFIFSSLLLHAQEEKRCFTTEVYRQRIKDHPEVLRQQEELERHTRLQQARTGSGNHISTHVYIIPIVFHIIHNYGPENISDAEVIDQVRILNDDYRKKSYDTAAVIPAFQSIVADCEMEFRLATLDPNGHCTNGIDRVASALTYHADDFSKLNPWDDNKYLNVWVVASLGMSGAAAYAYYPGTAPSGADGVIMLYNYVGSFGQGTVGRSRVLTHEIGHYLNLQHPWGNTNNPGVACGDDLVSDTPETKGWTVCNINGATCGNVVDNVQNYMDYSYCCNMFTEGQKTRMTAALTSFINNRNNLWTTSNLIATGTDTSSIISLCSPVTDFSVNYVEICAGDSVHYKDLSWNGQPGSWNWSFPGGTPSTSTDPAPVVYYGTSGFYDASLRTGNSAGEDSLQKYSYIRVNGPPTLLAPYHEGFEIPGTFPGFDGYILNNDIGNTWVRNTTVGFASSSCLMINNYSGNNTGETDDYITPAFDLSGTTALTMDFRLAYAQRNAYSKDELQVFVSLNCGKTWTSRYVKSGVSLTTAGTVNTNFIPHDTTDWRLEHISIVPYHNNPNVRFKFRNTSAEGNNIYIDDINIGGIVAGITESVSSSSSFSVFPNPAAGKFSIAFTLSQHKNVHLRITDALGREIKSLANEEMHSGQHQYTVDREMEAGIYFVVLEENGERFVKKILVTGE